VDCDLDQLIRKDKYNSEGPSQFKKRDEHYSNQYPPQKFYKYKDYSAQELDFEQPELSENQAEELKKKRLERFGPVDKIDLQPTQLNSAISVQ
jgi:hypothetical protein